MTKKHENNFGKDLANADDPIKPWPAANLLMYLGFPASARNILSRWYGETQNGVSLAEVFELVISSDSDPRPGYLISKLLDFRCVGRKTFLDVVSSISALNFGRRCNLLWAQKHRQFTKAHRVKGRSEYRWSFPITKEGENLAKFRNGSRFTPRRRK